MFDFALKAEALKTAVAGCAIAGYATAGYDYVTHWPVGGACSDIRPVTFKCALAGVAIAGYAVASWDLCACTETRWFEQDKLLYYMPENECNYD